MGHYYFMGIFPIVVRATWINTVDSGSPMEDFFVSLLLYPSVVLQMMISVEANINVTPEKKKRVDAMFQSFQSYSSHIPPAPPMVVVNGKLVPSVINNGKDLNSTASSSNQTVLSVQEKLNQSLRKESCKKKKK